MFKVGYIDDDYKDFEDYKIRLARYGIELQFVGDRTSLEKILDWILESCIECVLVDHHLIPKYAFEGTKVVAYINTHLPDLPCIILTNYREDSADDNLVMKNLILDRNIMAGDDIIQFTETIKQSVEVFRKRLSIHNTEYAALLEKKKNHTINATEEENFLHLFKLLKSYGEVDDVATELLKPEVGKKIDDLMEKLDQFIENNKK